MSTFDNLLDCTLLHETCLSQGSHSHDKQLGPQKMPQADNIAQNEKWARREDGRSGETAAMQF